MFGSNPTTARGPELPETRSATNDLREGASDAVLLGNNRELDRVYREHFAFVWRSLRRCGVDPEALDDAAQDVFMIALRRSAEFRAHSSYQTWLFGIAANIARAYRRKGRRAAIFDPIPETLLSPCPNPLEQATDAQALRLVEQFLETLDDAKRDVFILAELEQMTAPEIADALQIKLNTVYSRLRVARESFTKLLRKLTAGP